MEVIFCSVSSRGNRNIPELRPLKELNPTDLNEELINHKHILNINIKGIDGGIHIRESFKNKCPHFTDPPNQEGNLIGKFITETNLEEKDTVVLEVIKPYISFKVIDWGKDRNQLIQKYSSKNHLK